MAEPTRPNGGPCEPRLPPEHYQAARGLRPQTFTSFLILMAATIIVGSVVALNGIIVIGMFVSDALHGRLFGPPSPDS